MADAIKMENTGEKQFALHGQIKWWMIYLVAVEISKL